MDYSLQNHRSIIGFKVTDLPTPSFMLSLPTMKNIERLHQDVEKAKVTLTVRNHMNWIRNRLENSISLSIGQYCVNH